MGMGMNSKFEKIIRVIKSYLPGQKWKIRRDLDQLRAEYDEHTKAVGDLTAKYNADFEQCDARFEQYNARFDHLDARMNALENQLNVLRADFENACVNLRNNNDILKRHNSIINTYVEEDKKNLDGLIQEYSRLRADLMDRTVKKTAQTGNSDEEAEKADVTVKEPSNTYNSIDYFDFENHFRGPRDQVKEVQKIYLPYFEGKKNVLDLGCGRGEFTELLVDNGIGVTGIDMYMPYVEFMKMRGLPAVYGDALEYLKSRDSVDGIFMGQVVEHMPIETVIEILNVAYEKLTPGSYIIMETPNPMSLAVFTNSFYMDPSHNKPVHPLTLQYLAQKAGFTEANLLFTESSHMPDRIPELNGDAEDITAFNASMRRVENMLFGSQDYALIARKS